MRYYYYVTIYLRVPMEAITYIFDFDDEIEPESSVVHRKIRDLYPDDEYYIYRFEYSGTCHGCAFDMGNQEAHISEGGCLYSSDDI